MPLLLLFIALVVLAILAPASASTRATGPTGRRPTGRRSGAGTRGGGELPVPSRYPLGGWTSAEPARGVRKLPTPNNTAASTTTSINPSPSRRADPMTTQATPVPARPAPPRSQASASNTAPLTRSTTWQI